MASPSPCSGSSGGEINLPPLADDFLLAWAASISDPDLRAKTEAKIRKEMSINYRRLPPASQSK